MARGCGVCGWIKSTVGEGGPGGEDGELNQKSVVDFFLQKEILPPRETNYFRITMPWVGRV